jgi:hypothetical protein
MKVLIYIFFILLVVIFVLNDINVIYTNSVLLPDYMYISVALYLIPDGQWNQAYVPFPALFIFVTNLLTNTNPLTLLSIFYITYKYIYVFTYWLIARRITEAKQMILFTYWFLICTLLLLHDKVLLYAVPYNIVLLLLSYYYSNLIINNKFESANRIIYIITLTSILMVVVYIVNKNYLYSIFFGILFFTIFVKVCRINNLKDNWILIFVSFSYPIIAIPLLLISVLSIFLEKFKHEISQALITVLITIGLYNYFGNTSLLKFEYGAFTFSPSVFLFINQYLLFLFIFIFIFILMLINRTSKLIFINLLFFFILPIVIPNMYTYRYLHFILFIIPTTVIYIFRLTHKISNMLLVVATLISLFIFVFRISSQINIDIYSDFKQYNGIGELAYAEIYAVQEISSIIASVPLYKTQTYTLYGTYIDFLRNCYIVSDPYTSYLLASITRCRTYFNPIYVVPIEYTSEELYRMKLIRSILMNTSNFMLNISTFMFLLEHNISSDIFVIVISNRTAYYLKNDNCYFVFLDKSPHMYVPGNCYMLQPFNIPNEIVHSVRNFNFTKYIIDHRNFQVYYIVYSSNFNK